MKEKYGLIEIRGLIPELEYIIQGNRTADESLIETLEAANERGVSLDWRRLNEILSLIDGKHGFRGALVPNPIIEFLSVYLQAKPAALAVDPWAGSGILLAALAEKGAFRVGIGTVDSSLHESLAKLISRDLPLTWMMRPLLAGLDESQATANLIVSLPPPTTSLHQTQLIMDERDRTRRLRISLLAAGLIRALPNLSESGTAIVLVPDTLLDPDGEDRQALMAHGLFLNSVVALPSRVFPTMHLQQSLVFMSRKQTAKVFAGQLTLDVDPRPLVRNLVNRKRGALPELGVLIEADAFRSWASVVAAQHLDQLVQKSGATTYLLDQVIQEIRPAPSFAESPEPSVPAVYLPIFKSGPAVTALEESDDRPRFLQLIVKEDTVTPEYLAYFYNSPLGVAVLNHLYSTVGRPRLSRSLLRNSNVYLPPIPAQNEIISLHRQIHMLEAQIHGIASRLAGSPNKYGRLKRELAKFAPKDGLDEWMEELPFPLGSILWAYQASTAPGVRKQRLLHFFEALAQFLAVVGISAAHRSESIWDEACQELHDAVRLDHADFGTWINIWSNLSKKLRRLGSQPELLTEILGITDQDTVSRLLSTDLHATLQSANRLRNDWKGHDFAVTEQIERGQVQQLESLLFKTRAHLAETFSNLRMIQSKQTRGRNGAFRITAEILSGSRSPFKEEEIVLPKFLEDDVLYLWEVDNPNPLPLVPLLRVRPAPAGAVSTCYFYSRLDQGRVRWVAYHLVNEPEAFTDDDDVLRLVQELAGGAS